MALIFPKHGEEGSVARTLLAMSDNVRDVAVDTDNGFAFLVPEYLYERYLAGEVKEEAAPVSEEIVRRRPGRPRKVAPAKEGD